MDEQENIIGSYSFNLRELRRIATDEQPESVAEFLVLLDMQAHNTIEGETFQRQSEQEQKDEYRGG